MIRLPARLATLLLVPAVLSALFLAPLAAPPAAAQDGLRIVAIVNDDVVSLRDVNERLKVVFATTGIPDTPETRRQLREQVLRLLIDERLQAQESKRRNFTVPQEEVDRAIAQMERQMNIPAGRFEDFAQRRGMDPAVLINQIRAELTWGRLVRARFNATNTISEAEIDEAIAKLRSTAGQTEVLLSEILVGVDSPDKEEEARQTAQRIVAQLRQTPAAFPALARQFSRGTTAANGGDLGWVSPSILADDLEAAVDRLERGSISEPIRAAGGFYVLALRDRRRITLPGAGDAKLTLKQILLQLPANAPPAEVESTLALARTVREGITGCDDIEAMAKELKAPGSGSLGTVRLADLPENFRSAVADVPAGQVSEPVATPRAVHLFAVCNREGGETDGIDRNAVRNRIFVRRVELMAQRYMQDLRRDATIELR